MTVPSPEYLDPRLTEQRNPRTQRIDVAATLEIVDLINAEDATVAQAVRAVREDIARAIDRVVATLLLEFRDHAVDGAGDVLAHRLRYGGILGVDEIHDLERRGDVDALRPGIPLLGEARVEVFGRGNSHEWCRVAPS